MKSLFAFFCLYITIVFTSSAQVQQGEASYYKDFFEGRKTASGELFQQTLPTAAHRTLALGTIVKITNKSNGKSTKVRINDRGPYIRNRIIDVSKSVAERLGFINEGITLVEIEVINFVDADSFYSEMDKIYTEEIANQQMEQVDADYAEEVAYTENKAVNPDENPSSKIQEVEEIEVEEAVAKDSEVEEIKVKVKQNNNSVVAVSNGEKTSSKKEVEAKNENENEKVKVNEEVVDIVRQVTDSKEDKNKTVVAKTEVKTKSEISEKKLSEVKAKPTETENKVSAKELPIDDVVQKIFSQVQKQPKVEHFFDIHANRINPDFFAVQVASLSDAANVIDLGRKLEDFYNQKVTLGYKHLDSKVLFSLAIGNVQTRKEAEEMLEQIKDRYPYAFIFVKR